MGKADYLELGDWNIVCSMCQRKLKASMAVRNWQGMYRCPEHNEPRHPQDFVRGIPDRMTPPWTQPAPQPVYSFGDPLVTEASDTDIWASNFIYILTEDYAPITTE